MNGERPSEGIFILPGGLLMEGRSLREAELRPLTGYEEDWLALRPSVPSALAVTRLLSLCLARLEDVAPSRGLVQRLLVGDRDYLMLQLRRITLGDTVSAVLACPACSAKMDVDFAIADVPVTRHPQTTPSYSLDLAPQPPSPRGEEERDRGRMVRFRLPTGMDQEAVLELPPVEAADALLMRCLLDDGGMPLSPDERSAVIAAMEQLAPAVDLELDLTCPECGHTFMTPFDTTAFFLNEMRISGDQVVREVHALALHYHWSEGDILSLTRARRRAYLRILRDALG